MKNVLMIAYDFPPMGGPGVQRIVKFVKYLPSYGWNPIILTVDKITEFINIADDSFVKELPKDLQIYRTKIVEPYQLYHFLGGKRKKEYLTAEFFALEKSNKFIHRLRRLFYSPLFQTHMGWIPFAIWKGREILKQNEIDIIYSSFPGPAAPLIAKSLAKKYKKPWVADFRDPWTQAYDYNSGFFRRKLEEFLEFKVLREATKIVSVMKEMNAGFMHKYPSLDPTKFITIYNGYDDEDFQNIEPQKYFKFTIVYNGMLYKGKDPKALFKALQLLFEKNIELKPEIEVVLVGDQDSYTHELIDQMNLKDNISIIPFLPHKESLRYLIGASICYLNTMGKVMTGKLFEYLGSKRPILALIPEDSAPAEIIRSTKSGVVIDPKKTELIAEAILNYYYQYRQGTLGLERDDDSVISQFERKELTRKLATLFNEIC